MGSIQLSENNRFGVLLTECFNGNFDHDLIVYGAVDNNTEVVVHGVGFHGFNALDSSQPSTTLPMAVK